MATSKRPIMLFIAPTGWLSSRRKYDAELAEEQLETLRETLARAGWDGDSWTEREDAIDLARMLKPQAIVVPRLSRADGIATQARILAPAPIILVAIDHWDLKYAVQSIAYTGASGWLPYFDMNRLEEMAAAWRNGALTAAEKARFDALLPLPAPPTAAQKRRKSMLAALDAEIAAVDAKRLSELSRTPRDLVLSLGRRMDALLASARARKRDAKRIVARWPEPVRAQWLVWYLNGCLLLSRVGFPGFFEGGEARVRATLVVLEAMGAKRYARWLRDAHAMRTDAKAVRALEVRWRASYSKWPSPFPFQMRHALAHVHELDAAIQKLSATASRKAR